MTAAQIALAPSAFNLKCLAPSDRCWPLTLALSPRGRGDWSMDGAQAPRGHEHEGVGGDHEAAEEHGESRVHRGGEGAREEATEREEIPAERVEAHHTAAEMIRHVLLQVGANL